MPRTVLIVDDSPDSASLLEFALAPLAGLTARGRSRRLPKLGTVTIFRQP